MSINLITSEIENKISNPEANVDLSGKRNTTYNKEPINLSEIVKTPKEEISTELTNNVVTSFNSTFTKTGLTSLQNYLRSALYGSGEIGIKSVVDKYIDSNRCILSNYIKTDEPEGKLKSIVYNAPTETKTKKGDEEVNDTVEKIVDIFSIKYPTSYKNPLMSKNKTISDIKKLKDNKYSTLSNALKAVDAHPNYMIISGLETNITGNGLFLKFSPSDVNYKMASASPVQWQIAKYDGKWYITFDPRTSKEKESDLLKATKLLQDAWIPKNAIAKNTTITGKYTKIAGSTETSTNITVSNQELNETIILDDYMVISGLKTNVKGNGIYFKFNPTDANYKMAINSEIPWQLAEYDKKWWITFDTRTEGEKATDLAKPTKSLQDAWIPKNAIAKNTTITGNYTKIAGSTETSNDIKVSNKESYEVTHPSNFNQTDIPDTLQIKNVVYQIVIDPTEGVSVDSAFVKNFGVKVIASFQPVEQKINEETQQPSPIATIGIRRPEFNPQTWVNYSTTFDKNVDPLSATEFNKMFKSTDSKFKFSYNTENIKWKQQTKYTVGTDRIPVVGTMRLERVWDYSKQNWKSEKIDNPEYNPLLPESSTNSKQISRYITKLQYPTIMVRLVTVYVTYDNGDKKELLTNFNFTNKEVTSSAISKTTDKNTEFLFKDFSTTKSGAGSQTIITNFRYSQVFKDVTTGKKGTYKNSVYPTSKSVIPSEDTFPPKIVEVNTYKSTDFDEQPYSFEESTDGEETCKLSFVNFYLNTPKDIEFTSYTELTEEEHSANKESKKYINYFLPIYNSVTTNTNQPLTAILNCDLAFSGSIESLTYADPELPKKETLNVSMYQNVEPKGQAPKTMPSGVVVPGYILYNEFKATISLIYNKFDPIPNEWLDIDCESYSITLKDAKESVTPIYEGVLFTKTPEGVVESVGKYSTSTSQMLEFYKLISGNNAATIAEFSAYEPEEVGKEESGTLVFNYTNEKNNDGTVSKPGLFPTAGDTSKLSMFELVIQSISKEVNRNISSYIINDAIKSNTDSIIKLELYNSNVIVPNINTLINSTNEHETWINTLYTMVDHDRNNMKYTYNYIMNVDQKIGTYKTINTTDTLGTTTGFVVVKNKYVNNVKQSNTVLITLSSEVDNIVRHLTIKNLKNAGAVKIIPSAYIPDPDVKNSTIKSYNLYDINKTSFLADKDLITIAAGVTITLIYDGNRNWYIISTSNTDSIVKDQQVDLKSLQTQIDLLETTVKDQQEEITSLQTQIDTLETTVSLI